MSQVLHAYMYDIELQQGLNRLGLGVCRSPTSTGGPSSGGRNSLEADMTGSHPRHSPPGSSMGGRTISRGDRGDLEQLPSEV